MRAPFLLNTGKGVTPSEDQEHPASFFAWERSFLPPLSPAKQLISDDLLGGCAVGEGPDY